MKGNQTVRGPKRSDFLIEGKPFNSYAPATGRARSIWDGVGDIVSRGQSRRVVLNLDDSAVSMEDLRAQFAHPIDGLQEVLVIRNGGVTHLIP